MATLKNNINNGIISKKENNILIKIRFEVGEEITFTVVEKDIESRRIPYPPLPKEPIEISEEELSLESSDKIHIFPLTKWQTPEKDVTVYIDKEFGIYGTFNMGEDKIDVYFKLLDRGKLYCGYSSDYTNSNKIKIVEYWKTQSTSEEKITLCVEATTYFEMGQTIILELVEENIDESVIPYPENYTEQQIEE